MPLTAEVITVVISSGNTAGIMVEICSFISAVPQRS
jgi:hypothetical protein